MLRELPGEDEADGGLDLAGGDGGLLVVPRELGGLGGELLEDVVDEGVHDGHGLGGDADVRVHLLQHLEDVDLVRLHALLALLPAPLALAAALLAGGLASGQTLLRFGLLPGRRLLGRGLLLRQLLRRGFLLGLGRHRCGASWGSGARGIDWVGKKCERGDVFAVVVGWERTLGGAVCYYRTGEVSADWWRGRCRGSLASTGLGRWCFLARTVAMRFSRGSLTWRRGGRQKTEGNALRRRRQNEI